MINLYVSAFNAFASVRLIEQFLKHRIKKIVKMKISIPDNSRLKSKDFIFGVATSSFQIEGAVDKREPCIWDTFCAHPGRKIKDDSNGDIACDHYHLWDKDVDLIASLGVDAYRFSVCWPRVVRNDGSINEEGLQFYINLLDKLNRIGIKPFVTLYHWDLPQHLEDNGGWLNRETAYAFRDYANIVSKAFGDRVTSYATLNEPFCSAHLGYEVGVHAPGHASPKKGRQAAHHLLLAHGLAMQVLRNNCPQIDSGIVLNFTPCYSLTDSDDDKRATELADQYINQWYMQPIMEGKYPEILQLLPADHQPEVVDGDMEIISQPLDFLGINFYTRLFYKAGEGVHYIELPPENCPITAMGWEIYPQALTDLLVSLNKRYQLPPIYITENGAAMDDELVNGEVNDNNRIEYYHQHLNALHEAINLGVEVKGYFAWSLMDNFEWAEGYIKRFGIVYVDFDSQQRTLKSSAIAYRDFISNRE